MIEEVLRVLAGFFFGMSATLWLTKTIGPPNKEDEVIRLAFWLAVSFEVLAWLM